VSAPNYDAERFREPLVPDVALPPLRILVVEDEGLIALNLELILQRFGCDIVGPISKVDDIVDAAKTHRPDGAFLDVNLRGRKVFDVLPEMMGLGIPCVLSSGYDDPMLFPAAFRNMPRIAKPFDEAALHRACAEFGSLAEARQSSLSMQNPLAERSPLAGPLGGESHAVAFPIRRRFPLPELPVSAEAEEPAVAGLR
jgi:DNA-binding LytR/AlgR family response regulator